MSATPQPFEAEVARVLDLVINSLYKERDIFLRELVSNAADACDKLRYRSLSEPELLGQDPDLKIEIHLDAKAGVLTVKDNGIGMDADDLRENLGTIARSGTARFIEAMDPDSQADLGLIGQFGVGFYAVFMVADRVVVVSRKAGDDGSYAWASDGKSGFTVVEAEHPHPRGTSVVLHLKDDAKAEFTEWKLREIVRRYSDHVALPILFSTTPKEGEAKAAEQVNAASALWTRPKGEITDEGYEEFYHHVAHAFDAPFARLHFTAEGNLTYTALLFVPSERPFDLFDPKRGHKVKLYVKRVFISDSIEGLLPRYLRFVAGIVDSEDLSLNVSRETLQHGAVVGRMRRVLVKRLLDEIARRANAEDGAGAYAAFWENFGAVLKEGLYEDGENRPKLLELARFKSTGGDALTDLKGYVGRMKAGQDAILYISGERATALRTSPQLEAARAKGVEVLLLDDAVDDFWLDAVGDYENKPFKSLTKGGIDLSTLADVEALEAEAPPAGLDALVARIKAALGDEVADVRASSRLRESAVCLVAEDHGMDLRLERLMRQHGQVETLGRRVLEINPTHPLVREMAGHASADGGTDGRDLDDLSRLLLDQARIVEGEPLPDPGAFSRRMSAWLAKGV